MRIRLSAVGNSDEAFIERNYKGGLNIISSDDNNKGKTIVIQSLMYALGNEPTFPTTFNYKDYYHYVEFENEGKVYCLCRNKSSFVLRCETTLMVFDSVSELKRFWTKHIFKLPEIIKNQISKIVDPVLFLQLFFIGQDKKDTANIAHSGLYNKQDFYNMIYDMCDANGLDLDEDTIASLKDRLTKIKDEKRILLKQYRILKSTKPAVSFLSTTSDRIAFAQKMDALDKLTLKITELRKSRNAAATRKSRWESTLKELRSLNRTIECGELRCMDCNSTNIIFSSGKQHGYSFDVSSTDMRNEIIDSITEKIETYSEEIEKISSMIADVQDDVHTLMEEDEISLESVVAYKEDVFSADDAEKRIQEIDKEISDLQSQLKTSSEATKSKVETQQRILSEMVSTMNGIYHRIDPHGNLLFDDLFTKRDETYSGSEATVFHIVKLYSIWKALQHDFPIIIDSFRAEDLSTAKEEVVLDLFSQIPNQVILTTTLKAEEIGKYDQLQYLNHIDYKDHQSSKMLSSYYLKDFSQLISSLSIIF